MSSAHFSQKIKSAAGGPPGAARHVAGALGKSAPAHQPGALVTSRHQGAFAAYPRPFRAAVFHDPLTPLRLDFDFSRPTVSPGRLFALVKLWETSEARQALSTANGVCVSAPLLFASGFDLALWDRCRLGFRPSGFQRARLDVSTKRANPDHEQTAKCALTGCANPARPSGQKPQSSSSKKVMQSFIV